MKRLLALLLLLASAHAWSQTGPACLPQVRWPMNVVYGPIPPAISTRFDTYAVWVCTTPGGYKTTSSMFVLSNLAPYAWQYAAGTWSAAQAAADCATTCVVSTAAEYAFIVTIMQTNRPKALVAFNGANTTRSVYTTNADGTLNPTPLANTSVAVATPCDETRRIPNTPYYLVAGQRNGVLPTQPASLLPAGSYALCVVSFPIGSN